MFIIETVVVFGSFLGTKDMLGDLEVAVKKRDRNLADPDRSNTALAYAAKSGRRFSSFVDELFWAAREVNQILRRKREPSAFWIGMNSSGWLLRAPNASPTRLFLAAQRKPWRPRLAAGGQNKMKNGSSEYLSTWTSGGFHAQSGISAELRAKCLFSRCGWPICRLWYMHFSK